jgi:RNA ligase (TIGR02306 family)
MRKMATIRKIDSIRDIPGADSIECCTLGGWNVVTRKGEYTAGDLAVYCEIDSFIPNAIAPFLTKPENYPKVFEGVEGERLRTVSLRKTVSQGLLLPVTQFDETRCMLPQVQVELGDFTMGPKMVYLGDDVSELLGIAKYEAPVPAALAGEVKGMFPSVIPKTDQERVQNLKYELSEWLAEDELHWECTEKLEGSSMTAYVIDGDVGVCSRNLDLRHHAENSLWRAAYKYELPAKLAHIGRNIAIQGELVGNGIQGNIYQMRDQDFLVYDIYDIDAGCYFTPAERKAFVAEYELNHCPVLAYAARLTDTLGLTNMEQVLKFAEGKSVMGTIGCEREGLVFKCHEKSVSFKAISNSYLLRQK